MKCIGIVGSRRRNTLSDEELLRYYLYKIFENGDTIVSGGCEIGADNMAEKLAKQYACSITIHYPDWERYGKKAGHIRNRKIAEQADVLIALVSDDRTGGTESAIRQFLKIGKKDLRIIYKKEMK